jgi:GntR family transcriptional regulator
MKSSGNPPSETSEVVTTRMPDPTEREVMNMPAGIPVLVTTRITYGTAGHTPLETSNFAGCGDRSSQTYTVPIP